MSALGMTGLGADPAYSYTLVGTGIYAAQRSSSKRKKRRRAKAVMSAQAAERVRANALPKLVLVLKRIDLLRGKVTGDIRRAQLDSETLVKYSAMLGDAPEAEQFVQEVGGIQAVTGDLSAALAEYEVTMPRGDEPLEFITDAQEGADESYGQLVELGRQARATQNRARWLLSDAQDLVRAMKQRQQAEATAAQAKRRADLDASARADYLRRARAEQQRDLVWEQQVEARSEWLRDRRAAVRKGEADPGPYPEVPLELPASIMPAAPARDQEQAMQGVGLGNWFTELTGQAKKKEKKRAKRAQQQGIAAAEAEKARRIAAADQRRSNQLKLVMRDINAEAGGAAGWVARIRRLVNETPDLPARMIEDAMAQLSEWEATLEEVRAGIGELDLATEFEAEQKAYMGELQAALAVIRTIRIRASALRETIEAQVKLVAAHELRLSSLKSQQDELTVREKVLAMQAGSQQAALDLERNATLRAQARRAEAASQHALSGERQRLAELLRFLRQLERRQQLVQRLRSSA